MKNNVNLLIFSLVIKKVPIILFGHLNNNKTKVIEIPKKQMLKKLFNGLFFMFDD